MLLILCVLLTAAALGEETVTAAGRCGEGITWHISNTLLLIRGSGKMTDYKAGTAPWTAWRDQITEVRCQGDITSVGDYSFYGFSKLANAYLPASVTRIGVSAFENCPGLISMGEDQTKLQAMSLTAPTAKELTWTGSAQALLNAGSAVNGTLVYAAGSSADSAPVSGWSKNIPTATDAGIHYVWYMGIGNNGYTDIGPVCLKAEIIAPTPSPTPAATPTAKPTTVPKTGDGSQPLLWMALAALGLGAGLLLSRRRVRKK